MGLDVARLLGAAHDDGARLRGLGGRRGESRARCSGAILGVLGEPRARQGHARRLARDPRSRRLARAAPGRVDRQGGQGPHPGRPRAARPAGASTARIACSSTSGSTRRRTPPRTAPWRALEAAGQPVVRIDVPDPYQIAAEFFRWEFATAVAGAILGINPFDQPDVEASKIATRRLTDEFEQTGPPAGRDAVPRGGRGPALRRPAQRGRAGAQAAGRSPGSCALTSGGSGPGDYAALLAYVEMTARARGGAPGDPHAPPRPPPRRHLPRLRTALPPLDRPGLQGRAQHRRVPPDHVRRRPGPAGARPALHASAS